MYMQKRNGFLETSWTDDSLDKMSLQISRSINYTFKLIFSFITDKSYVWIVLYALVFSPVVAPCRGRWACVSR